MQITVKYNLLIYLMNNISVFTLQWNILENICRFYIHFWPVDLLKLFNFSENFWTFPIAKLIMNLTLSRPTIVVLIMLFDQFLENFQTNFYRNYEESLWVINERQKKRRYCNNYKPNCIRIFSQNQIDIWRRFTS